MYVTYIYVVNLSIDLVFRGFVTFFSYKYMNMCQNSSVYTVYFSNFLNKLAKILFLTRSNYQIVIKKTRITNLYFIISFLKTYNVHENDVNSSHKQVRSQKKIGCNFRTSKYVRSNKFQKNIAFFESPQDILLLLLF